MKGNGTEGGTVGQRRGAVGHKGPGVRVCGGWGGETGEHRVELSEVEQS